MFNDAQREAIETRVPTVLVSAGAGSGKTMVLTERYLCLLDEHFEGRQLRLEEILTLTFTRKAAQEMRARIARRLEGSGRDYERRELSRAPIGTIHSFCESVLREHALQAGIDPHFRLLDEPEARTLQETALDSVFETIWSGPTDERQMVGRLLAGYPHHRIRDNLLEIFRSLRTRGQAMDTLSPAPSPDASTVLPRLDAAVTTLLTLVGTAVWQKKIQEARARYDALRPRMEAAADFDWDLYLDAEAAKAALLPAGGPADAAKAAREAVKDAIDAWLGCYLDGAARPLLAAFCLLLERFDAGYRAKKNAQGLLDFEDLLLITRRLLAEEEGGAIARLRAKYRQIMVDEFQDTNPLQFSLINALQGNGLLFMVGDVKQAIYRFIGSDIQVFLGQEQRILGLDDHLGLRIAMQENYRTRPEILEPVNGLFSRLWPLERPEEGFAYEPLTAVHPFPPVPAPAIEFACWPASEGVAAELREREAGWIARRILQLTGATGEAALQVAGEDEEGAPLARPARFGDIILLFRASTDIDLYAHALREAGIPHYVVSGRGFFQSREVQDLLHMLRSLDNPLDDFSLAVALRSPLGGINDETLYWLRRDWSGWRAGAPLPGAPGAPTEEGRLWRHLQRCDEFPPIAGEQREALLRFRDLIRDLLPRMTAGQPLDLIDIILARTDYTLTLLAMEYGEQAYANVQKLREVAAAFQGRGIFDLSDFQRYLTQLSRQAPRESTAPIDVEGSNVVRMMTIHAAKGLEAPIVFLADGGREPVPPGDPFLLFQEGLACEVPTPDDDRARTAAYRQAVQALTLADRQEGERLLYVALTRAREHLVCCGFSALPPQDKQTRYADLLAGLLGLEAPVAEDLDLPVTFEKTAYPVRIWSPASLRAVEALQPQEQPPTLWETYREEILAGAALPVATPAEATGRYVRVMDRLQSLPPMRSRSLLRIGVHRILCYRACPRRYWFRYVLQGDSDGAASWPDDERALPPEEIDQAERLDGTEFGKVLHAIMQRVDFSTTLPAQLADILPALNAEEPLAVSEADRARLSACLGRIMALPVYPELQTAARIDRELRFLVREGTACMPGIIDALVELPGPRLHLLDYKSGRPSADHLRQLALYALGLQHTRGIAPDRLVLIYPELDGPRALRDEPVTHVLLEEARRLILEAEAGIRGESFPPSPGAGCTYCPYMPVCPQGKDVTAMTADLQGVLPL